MIALDLSGAFNLRQLGVRGFLDHDPKQVEKAGVISCDVLRELKVDYESKGPGMTDFKTSFTLKLEELNRTNVTIAPFIYPMEAAEEYCRFLFAGYPPNDPVCLPGGAREMVETATALPVRFT